MFVLLVALTLKVLGKCTAESNCIRNKERSQIKHQQDNHHNIHRKIDSPAKSNNITNMQVHINPFVNL